MISLQDKITKFEKLIYNKDLEDFIPIDEQFIGGGITMESLIKQNAFIVEELKKMKNVFVNYCKLNQTVYQKINQHQIALHSQTKKVIDASHAIDNKLRDSISQVKSMYEQMQCQSVKTETLVHEAIKPIKEEINKKVDQTSFTKQIKRIISQFQDGQLNLEEEQALQSNMDLNGIENGQPGVKKRKSKFLSFDEYQMQKQNINKTFIELQSKIQSLQNKNQENDPVIYKNTATINKINIILDNNQSQIYKLNKESKQTRTLINSIQQRLLNEISTRTHENVWERRFNLFESSSVLPKFQFLTSEINKNQKQNNKLFAELDPKFKSLKSDIETLFEQNRQHKSLINYQQQCLNEVTKDFKSKLITVEQKINLDKSQIEQKISKVMENITNEILVKNKEIQSVKNDIKQLSKTIEDKVLQSVRKAMEVKINEIEKNIHALTKKEKQIQEQIFQMKGEIHSVKQVLSKKANFSDILLHFQRKADKEDFKELRQKIQTAPSHLKSTILESPSRTRRTISASSKKRQSLSRNLVNASQLVNEQRHSMEEEKQMSSRMFIMGLETDMGYQTDRRMSFTESTRRKKKIKSSVGVLNLFP